MSHVTHMNESCHRYERVTSHIRTLAAEVKRAAREFEVAATDLSSSPCIRVLQCVAVCCSVLQCVAVWCSVLVCAQIGSSCYWPLILTLHQCIAVCCSCSSVLQRVAVCSCVTEFQVATTHLSCTLHHSLVFVFFEYISLPESYSEDLCIALMHMHRERDRRRERERDRGTQVQRHRTR